MASLPAGLVNPLRRCRALPRWRLHALVLGAALPLAGCQSIMNTQSTAQFRVIDASSEPAGIDIYENGTALTYNMGFGTVTSYIETQPGSHTISATATGTKLPLVSSTQSFPANGSYTVLVGNASMSMSETILQDRNQPAPSGQIALRLLDQAPSLGPVDVYLVPLGQKIATVAPFVSAISPAANTGYLNVSSGTYTVYLLPSGSANTGTPRCNGTAMTVASGSARSLVLIDQALLTTQACSVIVTDDYDSPTATN
jgi:hypothetical protein